MEKKKSLIIIGVVLGIFLLIGATYAFFTYYRESDKVNELIAGEIYMNYNEGENAVSLINVFPETAEEARAREDNVITFTINGKNTTTNKDIYYEIKLLYADDIQGKTRFLDEHLKFDLIETIDGKSVTLLDAISYDEINNTRIWVNTVQHNTTTPIERTYQLRMWLSGDILISDTEANADYTTDEFKNSYANVKVAVYGDFEEKIVMLPIDDVIKSKVGTDGLLAISTSGDLLTSEQLATESDSIREYRYSGSGKYCTYTRDSNTYRLNVEGETCPSACILAENAVEFMISSQNEFFGIMGATCSEAGGTVIPANETEPVEGDVRNYVEFNGEMWRIIGVFETENADGVTEDLVKIIKDTPISNDLYSAETYTYGGNTFNIKMNVGTNIKNGYYIWNQKTDGSHNNDWVNAGVKYYLNDSYYNTIDSTSQEMIASVKYYLGNITLGDLDNGAYGVINPVSGVYSEERNIMNVWAGNSGSWTGKIGLMYPSDFGYAANQENWSTALGDYFLLTGSGSQENWLHDNVRAIDWMISPSADSSHGVLLVYCDGNVYYGNAIDFGALSPVLYLKSNVLVSNGDGTEDNPYRLHIEGGEN